MSNQPTKTFYSYEEYSKDIKKIINHIKLYDNPHIVGLYRGSLPICTHISNIMDVKYSIIDFQSRDAKHKKEPQIIKADNISVSDTFFIIDDILDSGYTIDKVLDMIYEKYPLCKILVITLHYNNLLKYKEEGKYKERVYTLNNTNGEWIEYFWEKKPE
jgi:hypoxanthine phosphoribosyltransferase